MVLNMMRRKIISIFGTIALAILIAAPFLAILLCAIHPWLGSQTLSLALPLGRRLGLLADSLMLAGVTAVGVMLIGLFAATVLMNWRRPPWSSIRWFVLLLIPIPPYVYALTWSAFAGHVSGWMLQVGWPVPAFESWGAAWWVQMMSFLPFAVGLCLVGLRLMDRRLIEAACLVRPAGAVFFNVILPLMFPFLCAGAGLVFALCLLDYTVPSLFQVNVYALEVYAEYSATQQAANAIWLSVPLVCAGGIAVYLAQRVFREFAQDSAGRDSGELRSLAFPSWFRLIQVAACIIVALQVLVPLVSLVAETGHGGMARAWRNNLAELRMSMSTALFAALISIVPACLVAVRLRSASGWSRLWWALVIVPMIVPAPLIGLGLISLWNHPSIPGYGTALMPVLAGVYRFLPIAILLVYAGYRQVNPLLLDAVRILEPNSFSGWWRIRLPLMLPGIVAGMAVVFALTLGELGATLIVAPPGKTTLTIKIYNYLHYGASGEVAGLCLVMAACTVGAGVLVMAAFSWWLRVRGGSTVGS